jgi:hypothetical protein
MYFQCFQANLEGQFEFLMRRWANFRSHPQKGCGVDPLVGVDPNHPRQFPKPGTPPDEVPQTAGVSISDLTTIRGGDYFYFPSIPFLKHIDGRLKEALKKAIDSKTSEVTKLEKEKSNAENLADWLQAEKLPSRLDAERLTEDLKAVKLEALNAANSELAKLQELESLIRVPSEVSENI